MARTVTPRRGVRTVPQRAAEPAPSEARLYRTKNDLPEPDRAEVIDLLNQRLADCINLQTQCKQAHWNVKGPTFIALHKLFDEINESVEEYIDLIAERIVQLGGVAYGTAAVVAARSTLPEYSLVLSTGAEHVAALSDALAAFGRTARHGIDEWTTSTTRTAPIFLRRSPAGSTSGCGSSKRTSNAPTPASASPAAETSATRGSTPNTVAQFGVRDQRLSATRHVGRALRLAVHAENVGAASMPPLSLLSRLSFLLSTSAAQRPTSQHATGSLRLT